MKIQTHVLSPSSVRVMWRPFNRNEREVISGIRIVATDENDFEEVSPLIHQAVLSYDMDNLNPKSDYKINLNIVTHDGEPITFHSANPVSVKTPKGKFVGPTFVLFIVDFMRAGIYDVDIQTISTWPSSFSHPGRPRMDWNSS